MELAIDLAALALYDIVIYADDSGSMAFEEGGERVNDLKLIVGRTAEVAFDLYATASSGAGNCLRHMPVLQLLLSWLSSTRRSYIWAAQSLKLSSSCVAGGNPLR